MIYHVMDLSVCFHFSVLEINLRRLLTDSSQDQTLLHLGIKRYACDRDEADDYKLAY